MMNYGVFCGQDLSKCKQRILILGESHHGKSAQLGEKVGYTTESVVLDYLAAKRGKQKTERSWCFFTKIAHAFDASLRTEQLIDFWNHVCFGNYLDVNCDVKQGYAKRYLEGANGANRKRLNEALFQFVNGESDGSPDGIDIIVCVSDLVYRNLPSGGESASWHFLTDKHRNKISHCVYKANISYALDTQLRQDLEVYAISHPSGFGFRPQVYNAVLNGLLNLQ